MQAANQEIGFCTLHSAESDLRGSNLNGAKLRPFFVGFRGVTGVSWRGIRCMGTDEESYRVLAWF